MRKLISWILLTAALMVALFQWQTKKEIYIGAAHILRARLFPCSSPITYSIGTIDPAYNLTPEELASALKEAEAVWENPARRDLFQLIPGSGAVTVTFIYDNRQASLDKLKTLGIATNQSLASYKDLKARYEELTAKVDAEEIRLKGILQRYKQREAAYNARVQRLNRQSTVSNSDAWRIKTEKAGLAMQFEGIQKIERAVNADIDTLNALGTTLNQLIVQLSLNVRQYNREGSSLGTYEEGLYKIHGGIQTIDIYKYTSREQLVILLAHELGHALGLDHVKDPGSLMYAVSKSSGVNLTPDDLSELNRVCR